MNKIEQVMMKEYLLKQSFVVLMLLCLSVIGCASAQWVHSYKNTQDFESDKYDCEKVAEQSAANWGSPGNPFMILNEMKKCLRYKHGWQQTTKKEINGVKMDLPQ